MAEIKDYHCNYGNSSGLNAEITEGLGLTFPEAHLHAESMAKLSLAMKKHDKAPFCELPFCHTVEAEALGGSVNLGNEVTGPRAKEYVCTSVEELLDIPEMDFSRGRIHEVLETARILVDQGEQVMFEVCGPITVLNVLIDPKYLFKGLRRKPELMKEIFWKVGEQLLRFIKEIKKQGVQIISYADVVGGVNILGPKLSEQMVDMFTYDFVKELEKLADDKTIITFCPKTTFALLGTEKAELRDYLLPESMSYQEATIYLEGKIKIGGVVCMKNSNCMLSNGIYKEVILK